MEASFSRFAGNCHAWLDDVPQGFAVTTVGTVVTYCRWLHPPTSAAERTALWGYKVGIGGRGEYGVLGGHFAPHRYDYLTIAVSASVTTSGRAPSPFEGAAVGLPHEFVGGVLAGAQAEAVRLGPGVLSIDMAAAHEVDSSWFAFRCLSVGLVRLLALPEGHRIPEDLLPRFHAPVPSEVWDA